jgi:hypothetical protein
MCIKEGKELQTKDIGNLSSKIVAENFPNLEREDDIQMQETKDQKRNTPRHLIALNTENKERILKVVKEKRQVTYTLE